MRRPCKFAERCQLLPAAANNGNFQIIRRGRASLAWGTKSSRNDRYGYNTPWPDGDKGLELRVSRLEGLPCRLIMSRADIRLTARPHASGMSRQSACLLAPQHEPQLSKCEQRTQLQFLYSIPPTLTLPTPQILLVLQLRIRPRKRDHKAPTTACTRTKTTLETMLALLGVNLPPVSLRTTPFHNCPHPDPL